MASLIGRAPLAPLCREPSLRSEQVTQLVLGETATVRHAEGDWRAVTLAQDGYEGWVHRGYVEETDDASAAAWERRATGWSQGAIVATAVGPVRLPLRARVMLDGPGVRLPDGRAGTIIEGLVLPAHDVASLARTQPAENWALASFAGAPYEWGGVTPWGVDCSGLVQTTYLARGVRLPRDSSEQARLGEAVSLESRRAGDLIFFGADGVRITHVAFLAAGDRLIHSTVACGGVVHEPWGPGTRAAVLREQVIALRRLG